MFKKKGITLIALVITIIVLLILVGVTIALVIGPDGIVFKAQETKLASRYSALMDEMYTRRANVELARRTGIPIAESDDDFLNRLIAQGLIDLDEDEYDLDTYTLYVGRAKNSQSKYIVYGSNVLGDFNLDQNLIDTLRDTNLPENKHLKSLILIMKPISINEEVKVPISNTNGLEINWDYESDSENFEPLYYDLGVYPSHLYTEIKEYEVHIRGESEPGTIFGRYEDEDEGLDFYVNYSIIGLKSWGENGFSEFRGLGCRLEGTIPSPTKNSFINTQNILAPFLFCTELKGPIPENLFANCPQVTNFMGLFAFCHKLSGSIPPKLFINCPNVTDFRLAFAACMSLTGPFPEDLFDNCNKVTTFSDTFNGGVGLTGTAPKLWERDGVEGNSCYSGCEALSNYDDIPWLWK